MSVTLHSTFAYTSRLWGYSIYANFIDGTRVFTGELVFSKGMPDQKQIDIAVNERIARIQLMLDAPKEELLPDEISKLREILAEKDVELTSKVEEIKKLQDELAILKEKK